jgi:hypothetical protein
MEFHGGLESFLEEDLSRRQKHIKDADPAVYSLKRKLTGKRAPQKKYEYIDTSKKLKSLGYPFPSDLFSSYGIKMLSHKLGSLTAKEIPELLKSCFHLELTQDELDQYHALREMRNQIAHGRPITQSISDVTQRNKLLTTIALKIDEHFSLNYFIYNNYV